jgi:hypothetical protein
MALVDGGAVFLVFWDVLGMTLIEGIDEGMPLVEGIDDSVGMGVFLFLLFLAHSNPDFLLLFLLVVEELE